MRRALAVMHVRRGRLGLEIIEETVLVDPSGQVFEVDRGHGLDAVRDSAPERCHLVVAPA